MPLGWGQETVNNNANGLTLTLSLEQARELTFLKTTQSRLYFQHR